MEWESRGSGVESMLFMQKVLQLNNLQGLGELQPVNLLH